MRKTVFISVFQPFISRNILNTGVLANLLEQGFQIVLFVPEAKAGFYKEIYNDFSIFIEPININTNLYKKNKFFLRIAELLLNTNTKRFHKMQALEINGNYIRYFFEIIFTAILGNSTFIKRVFRLVENKFNKLNLYQKYFDKYKPNVVFLPFIHGTEDGLMLKAATVNKIPTVGMVLSWDNNTSKYVIPELPKLLIVQNEVIKEESIKLQAVPEKIIKLSGIPHYDYYKTYQPKDRTSFFNEIKTDSHKKLIVISPAGEKFISTDWQILEILKNAQLEGRISSNIQFLVRVHPTNEVKWGNFKPNSNFIIETPGVKFIGVRSKDNELDLGGLHHLLDTIANCDLVINVLSSIVIDSAVYNKPVITIGFNGFEKYVPFTRSVGLYLEEENMAKLLSVGATPVVKNKEELLQWIDTFLNNPKERAIERKKLIEQQCWKLDNKSAERIANYIADAINNTNEK